MSALRVDSGSDRQLVLECARGDAVPTHRQSTVTVGMDIMDVSESEDGRWREWKQKGRDEDARFQRRLRLVLGDVAGVVALGGALWFAW